ncbi:MAG: hypothetical protein ACRDLZ_07695 [Gaiellaceae bacterium]
MLVYIEYISRRPGVSLEAFHEVAGRGQTAWAGEYGEDQLVLNLGRTWRVGPEPEYVAVWYNAAAGLERIAEWERIFTSGEAARFEEPFKLAARIDAAGCYEPLLDPVPGSGGPYYAELFKPAPDASGDGVRSFFEERRSRSGLELNLLVERMGRLGPEPPGLAFWSLPSYGELATVARELDGVTEPVRLVSAALYADLGKEIL